jgi:hypothetical protein
MTIDGLTVAEWRHALATPAPERAAYSIREWCIRNGYSPSFYYKLQRQGRGPRTIREGRRTTISREADEEWRREREAASAPRTPEAV